MIPLLGVCAFYVYRSYGFAPHDFANYYFAARWVAEGRFEQWVYFPSLFNQDIAAAGYRWIFASFAPNTPFLALAFVPLTALPLVSAKLVFNLVSVVFLLNTLYRLARFYEIKPVFLIAIPVVFLVPIKNNLLFGQVYFVMLALVGESWLAYKHKRPVLMAALLSAAICFKVFPAVLLLHFIFRKKYRETVLTLAGCAAWVLVSVFVSGTGVWIFFFEHVLPKASVGEIANGLVPNYQSVWMFARQLLVYDATENPAPVWNSPLGFAALMVGFKTAMIATGYEVSTKIKIPLMGFSYWIFAMVLLSPYGSTYTFVMLLVPYFAWVRANILLWKKLTGVALMGIVCNIPVAMFALYPMPFLYPRLLALTALFLLFLTLLYPCVRPRVIAATTLVTVVAVICKNAAFPAAMPVSRQVLGASGPMLVYDYTIGDNQIKYTFWDQGGSRRRVVAFRATSVTPLPLRQNQVFYRGVALTNDPAYKQKPLLVDGRTLIYLSDEGRGIGFFTLRQIDLK